MVQAFTISFDFEGKTYLALASIEAGKEENISYSIRLYSTSLYRIFPDGILKFSCDGVECPSGFKHPLAKPLFDCIHESVHAHLKLARQHH